MSSASLIKWSTERSEDLDEILSAHQSLGGSGPGRRFATQQINHAYAVLLASQFQGFCRDLHSECADHFAQHVATSPFRQGLHKLLMRDRKLIRGNANSGSIGADFNLFDLEFWDEVKNLDKRNRVRQNLLDDLNDWRNAIAHQDFTKVGEKPSLQLQRVNQWRNACGQLAVTFDRVLRQHLFSLTGKSPW